MSRAKTSAPVAKHVPVDAQDGESAARELASFAIRPDVTAAMVVHTYSGKSVSLRGLMDGLTASMERSKGDDLSMLEAMLVGQAIALQSIFSKLAVDAQSQPSQRNTEALLGLALKAQAQSRATITAVVDLKHPRQALFVKQANIANGPQQVINGVPVDPEGSARTHTHVEEMECPVIELLDTDGKFGKGLDTGTTTAPARGHPAVATVEPVHRPDKRRR